MQVLHYDPDSMSDKLQYLKEIGMDSQQRAYSVLRLPQLLSLDVSHNMRPKYNYFRSQLGGSIRSLSEYPAYFSLSLFDRCSPLLITTCIGATAYCWCIVSALSVLVHRNCIGEYISYE